MDLQSFNHITVLKKETIEHVLPSDALLAKLKENNETNIIYVDATLGGGGHAEELVNLFAQRNLFDHFELHLIGFDQDIVAINYATQKLNALKNKYKNFHFHLLNENFSGLKSALNSLFPAKKIHGLYADFGVSSEQLDSAVRGFSFMHSGPLDMRMNTDQTMTARQILEEYSEQQLVRILFDYGEEPKARQLAKAIVQDRKVKKLPLTSTVEFAEYVKRILAYPHGRTHPATRTFQALRIEVNKELESIENFLKEMPVVMHPLARACFISFHSLEDGLVKYAMRQWQKGKNIQQRQEDKKDDTFPLHLRLLLEENQKIGFGKENPRGGLTASDEECKKNPRARSARLRCFEFLSL